ncbi:UNVERIFIED_ORG: hypothetical protein J2W75_002642 [Methylorubrum zatmanii]|nr:hypothetical protein [Methylorubrum extorquens]MDH6666631.1 hypothetical protein [Methylorubrum zatmanii]
MGSAQAWSALMYSLRANVPGQGHSHGKRTGWQNSSHSSRAASQFASNLLTTNS